MKALGIACIVLGLFGFFISSIWAMAMTLPTRGHPNYGAGLGNRVDVLVAYGPAICTTIGYVAGVALVARAISRLRRIGIILAAGSLPSWLASILWLAIAPNADHLDYTIKTGDGGWVLGPIVLTSMVLVAGLALLAISFAGRRSGPRET